MNCKTSTYVTYSRSDLRIAFSLLFSLLIAAGIAASAQSPLRVTLQASRSEIAVNAYVSETVDIPPSFPGGDAAMMRFINAERRYPRQAYEQAVEGRVLCGFIVDASGKVSNLEVVRGVEESLNREALRIIESMPQWKPGVLNGEAVSVYYLLPIPFRR